VQLLRIVFGRQETDSLGFYLLENGLCCICASAVGVSGNLEHILPLFCNIAGGTEFEKDLVEEVFPLEFVRDLIADPSKQVCQVQLCNLLRLYSRFAMPFQRSLDFFRVFSSIWSVVPNNECRVHVLWAIYWHNQSLKSLWADQVKAFGLAPLFHESLSLEDLRLTVAALKCIVQLLECCESFDLDLHFLHELMKSGDDLAVELGCWVLDSVLRSNPKLCRSLRDSQIISDLLAIFSNGSYDLKREAAFSLCAILQSDPVFFLPIVQRDQIVENLIEVMRADPELTLSAVESLAALFRAAATRGLDARFAEALMASDGKHLFEELQFRDDEDVAAAATQFLIQFIDNLGEADSDGDSLSE